ncbi:3-oxoacyl-ACP synthase [Ekhidna sp.]
MDKEFKRAVHQACEKRLEEKIVALLNEIDALKESASNETKSSMGDKYETGREMIMQERNKLGEQLDQFKKQQVILSSVNMDMNYNSVKAGSLVQAQNGTFYISVPIGELNVEGDKVFAISPLAPLSNAMMGLKRGEVFNLKGGSFEIEELI